MVQALKHKLSNKQFFGHPAGLFILFFAEMWERMSYYGMRALLVLYMLKYLFVDPTRAADVLGFDTLRHILESGFGPLENQPLASQIYGLYTGFVYLSPFFGGILADKIWGKRKSVYIGGILMVIGHFLMAFQNLFLPALFFLILGNGAFKPNISTQVGALYKEGDARRDGAFTIFYMGINLGAFFSPFLCKSLAVKICEWMGVTDAGTPWHLGFSIAGIGMVLGIVVYHFGQSLLPVEDTVARAPAKEHNSILVKSVLGLIGIMAGFLLLLMLPTFAKILVLVATGIAIVFAINKIKEPLDRSKVSVLVVLCIATIFFWAIFEQQGNALQVWADEKADWARLGLDAEIYQSFNPAFIFIFAPLLDMWWTFRSSKGKKISSVRKMAMGSALAGFAFLIVPLASAFITIDKSLINMFWLAITTLIFTLGELYLSPIGLSFVTKVAPARFMSMMMGMWFLSSFLGNYLAGALGGLYSTLSNSAFFMVFAVMGGVLSLFFLISEKKIRNIVGHDI
jgi:proton-dependent oligopeptide transporter, POT family